MALGLMQMRSFAFQFMPSEGGEHCRNALQVCSPYTAVAVAQSVI